MALAFLLLIMVFARVILRITDRGSVERAVFLRAHVADRLVELYETMAERFSEDEMPCECDAVMERLDPMARWRISLAYGARLVLLAILCQAFVIAGLAPAWALAVIPAASTFLLPALDAWLLARQGRTAPPAKTPAQRAVEIMANLICGVLAWAAFSICLGGREDPLFLAFTAYVLLSAAYLARRLGMRLAQRYASPQFDRCATQDTVLYLRSFSDDHLPVYSPVTDGDLRSLLWPRISFEEFVSYCAAATCGNLITIGRPGERLPRAGAWRSYFDDDAWQEAVRLTMLRCGTILLTVGSTEALSWEIRHVKKWGMLNKCVFLVPPLPGEQARRRLELTLDALGIQEDEKNGEIPESPHFIAGFRILPGGSVQWLLCTGRDWGAYFFSIARSTGAASRRLRTGAREHDAGAAGDGKGALERSEGATGGDKGALERAGREARARRRPLSPSEPVAKAARMTAEAGALFEAQENYAHAAVLYGTCIGRLSREPDSSPEALMYLRVMRLRCKIRAGTWSASELIPEMERLVRDAEQVPFVWISPTFEVLGRDGFQAWMLSKIAAFHCALGNRGEERAAWERCLEAATRAGGVPGATDAHINLALLGRDPAERREHAERALELAESISDARRIAEAQEWLAHALANERDERWLDDLIDAIRALSDLGESERALGACRRGIVDANVLEDEQAKRKLLELEAEIAGAEGAPHHPASREARQQH